MIAWAHGGLRWIQAREHAPDDSFGPILKSMQ